MYFSLEILTIISILSIGGFFVVASFEKDTKKELKDLKDRVTDLENGISQK